MMHCYVLTLALAEVLFTVALPSSHNDATRVEPTLSGMMEMAGGSSSGSLGPSTTFSKKERLERLVSEIANQSATDGIACESPHPNYNPAGFLPHPGSCRKFYLCDQQSQSVFIYKCPPGLVFDKEYGLCSSPLSKGANEDCHEPEVENYLEISGILDLRKRRSANSQNLSVSIRCEEEANGIINATEEIRIDAITIENYIIHIQDLRPLVASLPSSPLESPDPNFGTILQSFNTDLEMAQKNTRLWKGDDGVYEAINQTLTGVKNFDPLFNEGFRVNLQRIGLIKTNEGTLITGTSQIIKDMESRIAELENILVEIHNESYYGTAKASLDLEKIKLEALENAYEISEAEFEFPKVINFLNFVINNTMEVQKAVSEAEKRLEDLEGKIFEDSSKFQRHLSVAESHVLFLKGENNKNVELKASLPQKKRTLLLKKKNMEGSLRNVRKKKANVEGKLRQLKKRSKRSPIEPLTIMAIVGGVLATAGITVGTAVAINDHNAKKRKILNAQLSDYEKQIYSYATEIRSLEKSIDYYDKQLAVLSENDDSLQKEITYFSNVLPVFQDMKNTVTPVITLVTKAKESVISIGNIFEEVLENLTQMTDTTTEAKDHLKKRNFKYFIYNEIDVMKCTWEDVSARLTSLEDL